MQEFLSQVFVNGLALSLTEAVAVSLGIAYLALAMRQSSWCWYAAFAGTALGLVVFWQVSLLMEAALNLYYLIMAVYGWWCWRGGKSKEEEAKPLAISRWRWQQHLFTLSLIAGLSLISGYLLANNTQAALPYLDSFTTWGAVITTFMVARKVLENWLYWLVVNSAAFYMYLVKDLYFYSALMAIYLVMVIFGWLAWRKSYLLQANSQSCP